MTFNSSAECLDLLDKAYDNNLVQFGENVQRKVNFICNCCGCCCEAMALVTAKDFRRKARRTARVLEEICLGCGVCARVCPAESISLTARETRVLHPGGQYTPGGGDGH